MPRKKGFKHSEETKLKMSLSRKGKKRVGWSPPWKGKKRPAEVGIKISMALTGRKLSSEHCKSISESHKGHIPWNKGIPMSEEQRLKVSKAKMGFPAWNKGIAPSMEVRKKLSKAHTGKSLSDEHRKKISEGNTGKKMSVEAIRKISEGRMRENNPNWKGGTSREPYCDVWSDKDFKESIKERDKHKCQNPDCWHKSKELVVHHINYTKIDCNPKNLVTLCRSCNIRANTNRGYWIDLYSQCCSNM